MGPIEGAPCGIDGRGSAGADALGHAMAHAIGPAHRFGGAAHASGGLDPTVPDDDPVLIAPSPMEAVIVSDDTLLNDGRAVPTHSVIGPDRHGSGKGRTGKQCGHKGNSELFHDELRSLV
jgi:hypothetical protein